MSTTTTTSTTTEPSKVDFGAENEALSGAQEGNYVTFRGGSGTGPGRRLVRNPGDPGYVDTFDSVPVVDFTNINHPDKEVRRGIATDLAKAAHEVGFWYAKGAPISRELIEDTFANLEKFFALPLEEKQVANWNTTPGMRGYEPAEDVRREMNFKGEGDLRESFFMGDDFTDPVQWQGEIPPGYKAQNAWPEKHPWFKEAMDRYYRAIMPFAKSILRLFALALDLDEDAWEKDFVFPITALRGIHYPPVDMGEAGIVAHADYSSMPAMTMVLQGEKYGTGLQVLDLNGHWHPVPYLREAPFVCNIGDFLQHLSDGKFVSTVHRVINSSGKTRMSIPFFISPDPHVYVRPVVKAGETRKTEINEYEEQSVGKFFIKRLLNGRKNHPTYKKVMAMGIPMEEWDYSFVTGGLPDSYEKK